MTNWACNDEDKLKVKFIGAVTSTRSRVSRGSDNGPAVVSSPHPRRLKQSCVCAVSYNFFDLAAEARRDRSDAFPAEVSREQAKQETARTYTVAHIHAVAHIRNVGSTDQFSFLPSASRGIPLLFFSATVAVPPSLLQITKRHVGKELPILLLLWLI
ncbi:hypothetical protein X777_03180 [Ooceraea biroi]|uniref:Uncharacterized protein n=1 Tax=Ooceraea biroi TaxID=2015173 RepID=A0A026VSA7_OOCBI|nr:hypothetical protein X777_03180 [Ooceraea biroi]